MTPDFMIKSGHPCGTLHVVRPGEPLCICGKLSVTTAPVTADVQRELNPRDRLAAGLVFDAGFAATTTEARAAADALLAEGGAVQILIADAEKRGEERGYDRGRRETAEYLGRVWEEAHRASRAALDPAGAASGEMT